MNQQISLIVADDHPMLLKGLVDELTNYNYKVLATATNGAQALDKIITLQPAVALLDIEMPLLNGFEVIRKCKDKTSATKFIILTSHKEKGFVLKARKLNILGYIMKDEPFLEVHNCIQSVVKNKPYFSSVFTALVDNVISPQLQKIKFLSPSERTIVRLVAQGLNTRAISEQLSISPRTVEKHRSNIIAKLELPPQQDALNTWAQENKELILTF
jgi:DNA-binding NarL/FixJ family response regulator